MKRKLKYLILTVITIAVICSCANNGAESDLHKEPEPVLPAQTRTLELAVQNGISETAMECVEYFAQKVYEISEGKLSVEMQIHDDLLEKLDSGSDLAFGKNEEFARANGDFLIYSSPFYFNDYNHLTMTLNSRQFYNATVNTNTSLLKAAPIGAFYDGGYYIISSREEMYDTIDQYNGRTINIVGEQPLFETVLEAMGANVRSRDEGYMLSNFGKNRNISAMECEITSLGNITKREKVESFHICKSFHRAKINWMMLSQNAQTDLSEYEMAVLTEAMAYAIAKNDNAVLARENESMQDAYGMGGAVTAPNFNEFSSSAENTLKNSSSLGSLWDWLLYDEVKNLAL